MNTYRNHAVNKNFHKLRVRFKFSCMDIAKFLDTNIKNIGAYEEGRAQVPISIVKQLVDRGMIGKRDLYPFLFDPRFEKDLKSTKRK